MLVPLVGASIVKIINKWLLLIVMTKAAFFYIAIQHARYDHQS